MNSKSVGSEILMLLDSIISSKMEQNKEIQYVIGIDLGHGETSAALCAMEWNKKPEQLDAAKDLEMGGNKKVMPSAITILDNGDAYIGDAAFNPEILKQAEVRVCFKQAPKDINGENEQIMIRYMHEVYNRIINENSGLLTKGNHLVYIATPSGWDKETQRLYVQMAKQAGLPILDNGITKESRAAFVRAQHDATSGIARNIDKGAIVFDMGSSTLDFTYMNRDIDGLIDYGYDCGASAIEKAIYNKKGSEEDCVQLFAKKYPKLIDYLVFEARKIKEQVYFDPTQRVKKTLNFEDFVDDEDLEDERLRFMFPSGELNKFLEEIGYIQSIRDAMIDYRNNHISGQKIFGVFMTGGASRMDFLKPLICECWGVTEEQIHRDQDPSLTISQGVAELARMDLRTEGMDEGIEPMIDHLLKSDVIYNTFMNIFCSDLKEHVTSNIANTITEFRDSSYDYNISTLENNIRYSVKKSIDEDSAYITDYMEFAIKECTQELRDRVDAIIANYVAQGQNIEINSYSFNVSNVKIDGINMNAVLNDISKQIAADSSSWSGAITGAAIGGAIAMLLGGPLMWLVGGAAYLGSKFFGGSEEDKTKKAKAKRLNREERRKVYDSINEKWNEICNNVNQSIDSALHKNTSIKDSISTVARQMLTAYKESLKNSRILID